MIVGKVKNDSELEKDPAVNQFWKRIIARGPILGYHASCAGRNQAGKLCLDWPNGCGIKSK
jgi:hypothetical protein